MRHIALWQTLAGCALILAAATSQATVYDIETSEDVEVTAVRVADGDDTKWMVTSQSAGDFCSLREALYAINYQQDVGACEAGSGSDTIKLKEKTSYLLEYGQLPVGGGKRVVVPEDNEDAAIPEEDDTEIKPTVRVEMALGSFEDPEGKEFPVISAAGITRLFSVEEGARLGLENIILSEGGESAGDGGLILAMGDVSLVEGVTLRQGLAVNGGAVFLGAGGSLNFLERTLFEDNTASGNGAVVATSADFDGAISGYRFYLSGNESESGGGMFYVDGADGSLINLTLVNGTITNNQGGVIQLLAPKHFMALQNMTVAFNGGLALHLDEAVVDAPDPDDPEADPPEASSTSFILNTVLVGNDGGVCAGTALDGTDDADATLFYTITDDSNCPLPREQTEGTPVTDDPNGASGTVLLGVNREVCAGSGQGVCEPIPAEDLGGDFPGFLPNPEPAGLDPSMPSATPSLFDRGNPENVGDNQCDAEDMRGKSRGGAGGRCDVGAVEFLRARAQADEIGLISGKTVLGDVLENDKNDALVDCGRLEPIIINEGTCGAGDVSCLEGEIQDRCMSIIVAPERGRASVEIDEQGYPRVRYTPATSFHGVDQLRYVVSRHAFEGGTDIGLDQSERANLLAEPASGLTESKSILGGDSGGSMPAVTLLLLGAAGLVRRWRFGLAMLMGVLSAPALAADIEVNSLLDHSPSITNDGLCTLREALENAATFSSSDCEFGAKGEDRILLPAGDIQLVDTLVIQGGSVELVGKGVRNADDADPDDDDTITRILGDGENRLFEVRSQVSNGHPSVVFRYLVLERGNAAIPGGVVPSGDQGFGGVIITGGSVIFDRVVLRDNRADRSGGVVYVRANAGNDKQVSFNRTYIKGSEALQSGGVMSTTAQNGERFRFAAVDSTFEGNIAGDEGGAFDLNIPDGDFIAFSNSTFVDNSAPKGAALDLSGVDIDVRLMNLTFLNNTGGNGIELGDTEAQVRLANSIVAGSGASCSAGTGLLTDSVYNLFSDASCIASGTSNNNDENVGGTAGLLEDSGGATGTETDYTPPYLSMQDTSDPLIVDAGNDEEELQSGTSTTRRCRDTDLRGISRTSGGRCDRGAFEYQQITATDDDGNNERAPDRRVLVDIFANDLPSDGFEIEFFNSISLEMFLSERFTFIPAEIFIPEDEEAQANPIPGSYVVDPEDSSGRRYVLEDSGSFADGSTIEFVWEFYNESVDGFDVKCGEPLPQRFIDRNPDQYDDGDVAENCVVLFVPSNDGVIPVGGDLSTDAVCEAIKNEDKEKAKLGFIYQFEDSAGEQSPQASVIMSISNKAPKITGQTRASRPGEPVTFRIEAEDPDSSAADSINWGELKIKDSPNFSKRGEEEGQIETVGLIFSEDRREVTYIPDSNFSPFKDSFTLTVEDHCGSTSSPATFTITYPGEKEDNSAGSWGIGVVTGLLLLFWRRRSFTAA